MQHFLQHLDACGTAGLHGAWFGWYGEDDVDLKDAAGRLVFTNDLQLLRAIPNWDNLAGIEVPLLGRRSPGNLRHWNGTTYRSPRSYASKDVIWSRRPETDELFAVFRSMEGRILLPPADAIERAVFADSWVSRTAENALDALDTSPDGSVRLRSGTANVSDTASGSPFAAPRAERASGQIDAGRSERRTCTAVADTQSASAASSSLALTPGRGPRTARDTGASGSRLPRRHPGTFR